MSGVKAMIWAPLWARAEIVTTPRGVKAPDATRITRPWRSEKRASGEGAGGEEEEEGLGGGGGSRSFAPFDQVLRNEIAMHEAAMVAQYSVGTAEDIVLAKKWTGILTDLLNVGRWVGMWM